VAIEGVFRDHWGRVLATLVGMFRDIELART
jgi:predicted RNA polymerase sigma factor